MPKPSGSAKEPMPGAPGQTQFFIAAAGVSKGAKIKKLIFFIIGILAIGAAVFLFIHLASKKDDPADKKTKTTTPAAVTTQDKLRSSTRAFRATRSTTSTGTTSRRGVPSNRTL